MELDILEEAIMTLGVSAAKLHVLARFMKKEGQRPQDIDYIRQQVRKMNEVRDMLEETRRLMLLDENRQCPEQLYEFVLNNMTGKN